MPYNSGAVATERSSLVGYKMPVTTSRYSTTGSTTSSSYRTTGTTDRPYYSSTTGSYTRSTIPRSYSIDTKSTYTSGTSSLQGRTSSLTASRQSSLSEDSGISSRAGSYSSSRADSSSREPSLSRSSRFADTSLSTGRRPYGSVDTAADLYSKYSPSNYVPNSDAGRPPARSATTSCLEATTRVRRAEPRVTATPPRTRSDQVRSRRENNNDRPVSDEDDCCAADDNGNDRRLSVAEIRRRFDPRATSPEASPPPAPAPAASAAAATSPGDEVVTPTADGRRDGPGDGRSRFSPSPNVVRKVYSTPERPISSSSSSEEDEGAEMSSSRKTSTPLQEASTSGVNASSPVRHRSVPTSTTIGLAASPRPAGRYQRSSWMTSDDSDTDGATTVSSSIRIRERSHSSGASASLGLVGIRNLGNTCFMNSVVQCLSNTKPLKQYLLDNGHLSDLNTTISEMKGGLIKAFATVIQELWDPSATIVSPNGFKSQIGRFAPRFNNYNQQDAQEFLRYLLEGLHEDVNRVRTKPVRMSDSPDNLLSNDQKAAEFWKRYLRFDNSKIVDIFVGQLCSTLRCTVCQHSSLTFDPFWDLSLPLPTRTGTLKLQQCFDHFTKEEVLDGDEKPTCAKCQMRRKCTKSLTIQKFPKILVLHLKRFSPNERYRAKLSVPVTFPLDGLDLSSYAESKDKNCYYRLYGIANHSGTTYSGHYMAYCKHPVSGDWHQYNDTRVSSISTSQLVSSEAYLLFYEQTTS